MIKENYVDMIYDEIMRSHHKEKLFWIEEDIDIAKGLGQINDPMELRFLKLTLQTRLSYLIFNNILTEIEKMNNITTPENGLFENFEKEMKRSKLKLLS